MVELKDYQKKAVSELKNGSILCGGVGSGKSITALAYYMFRVCQGTVNPYSIMKDARDLYIITTAKKRDSLEWEKECVQFILNKDPSISHSGVKVTIDSWNNIKKYKDVYGAFFIFDEQRLVGSGVWVKTFLNLARKNQWILLTATPGDQWSDYIPVFVANGFYKNKTEFCRLHCVYSRFAKYPKIERYVGIKILWKHRDEILVPMKDPRHTVRHDEHIICEYDKNLFKTVYIERWNPYENEPIQESGKWVYLMRRAVNSDPSRIRKLVEIYKSRKKIIVFYNFNYELEVIRSVLSNEGIIFSEWNGQKHEEIPGTGSWVYLVQYSAGCEGWNCIETDTIVFFSQNYSYRVLEQARGRIDRMNTPYVDLYYYHLRSRAVIDTMIYAKLKNKKNFNESSLKFGR